MHWRIKGAIQAALGRLPGGEAINDYLQRSAGTLRAFDVYVESKIKDDWFVQIEYLKRVAASPAGLDVVEIGAGWFPALPICYHLAGAKSCIAFDAARRLDGGLCFRFMAELPKHLQAISERLETPREAVEQRFRALQRAADLAELLRAARIEYRAPADACNTGLPDSAVDLVFSNDVLEHVPPAILAGLMNEAHRIVRPGGHAVHNVNCGDHYAYFDRAITQVNYLQFTDEQWAKWNNRILYQNRLRGPEFVDSARLAGFDIVLCEMRPRANHAEALRRFKLPARFAAFSLRDLSCTSAGFVARKPV